jgi:hypothetical protein
MSSIEAIEPVPVPLQVEEEGRKDNECPVCYELIDNTKNNYCKTVCGHMFCFTCIANTIHTKNACPICRKTLYTTTANKTTTIGNLRFPYDPSLPPTTTMPTAPTTTTRPTTMPTAPTAPTTRVFADDDDDDDGPYLLMEGGRLIQMIFFNDEYAALPPDESASNRRLSQLYRQPGRPPFPRNPDQLTQHARFHTIYYSLSANQRETYFNRFPTRRNPFFSFAQQEFNRNIDTYREVTLNNYSDAIRF